MHNDVNNAVAALTCIVVVAVTHESNVASHFPEAGNADMCPDVAEPVGSRSGDLFELLDKSNTTFFYYLPHTTSS